MLLAFGPAPQVPVAQAADGDALVVAQAQKKRPPRQKPQSRARREAKEIVPPAPTQPVAPPAPDEPEKEKVEADVSTRTIAVTSGFTGKEIIVFGTVANSRQPSPDSGYYDVVVVVEGAPRALVSRRKSRVAGLWMNTASVTFDRVPSFYAIASTRPVLEIAEPEILAEHAIGLENAQITPRHPVAGDQLKEFRQAVVRLKEDERLYVHDDLGVAFIGRSLFRSTVLLPANVPVGSLIARVHLFREGKLLSSFSGQVQLEREGVELLLYDFAHRHAFFYGLFAVAVALAAGLAASAIFRTG